MSDPDSSAGILEARRLSAHKQSGGKEAYAPSRKSQHMHRHQRRANAKLRKKSVDRSAARTSSGGTDAIEVMAKGARRTDTSAESVPARLAESRSCIGAILRPGSRK
ncbi:hypothetical protein, partial [Bradyrhizobium sp.]|uniref:hypothetical protein n=1 Tax=Bradyrhizobium sp. TaxID=376 RepID=UPI003C6810BF